MSLDKTRPPEHDSPPWGRTTKLVVALLALLLFALIARRFQSLIGQLIAAAMLAYILNPIVVFIDKRTSLRRGMVLLFVYLLVAIAFVWASIALGVAAFEQISALIALTPQLVYDTTSFFQSMMAWTEPFEVGAFTIDPTFIPWDTLADQLLSFIEPLVSRSGQFVRSLATATLGWISTLFFVYVISIYFANELPQVGNYIGNVAHQPGYRKDAERLTREFGRIWSAYLRGQVILGLVIFLTVWLGLAALGVRNALALGLVSGLLEFIPVIGPVVGALAACAVAFFQPDNYLSLAGWQYSLVVLGFMILVQQVENNLLVPRIVGEALDLHPLVVMVGVFMGGSLAGILGAVLAAPVVATLKLLSVYAWHKMFDLPPFPEAAQENMPARPTWSERARSLMGRIRPS